MSDFGDDFQRDERGYIALPRPNARLVDITDEFNKHSIFLPPSHGMCIQLLKFLSVIGMKSPVVFGGVLRDMMQYLRLNDDYIQPRDLDVAVSRYDFLHDAANQKIFGGKYPIDIILKPWGFSYVWGYNFTKAVAASGDAPINSVAMNETGEIIADERFLHDLEHGIYRIFPENTLKRAERAVDRFRELSQREGYRGLKLVVENDEHRKLIATSFPEVALFLE